MLLYNVTIQSSFVDILIEYAFRAIPFNFSNIFALDKVSLELL